MYAMTASQFSETDAQAMYESDIWKDMTAFEIVALQLYQERVCLPFDLFRQSVAMVLNREVDPHEFHWRESVANLKREFEEKVQECQLI